MSKLALFIDAAYLDRLAQGPLATQAGGKRQPLALDYRKLPAVLAGAAPWRTFYYYALPWTGDPPLPAEHAAREAKQRFAAFLKGLPRMTLREGVVERRTGPRGDAWLVQKRADVALAVDLTRLAWTHEIDRAVLVAGDSDFVPAVEDARRAGVHLTLRHDPATAHADLVAACDAAVALTRASLNEAVRPL